jgi:hypothetical protein
MQRHKLKALSVDNHFFLKITSHLKLIMNISIKCIMANALLFLVFPCASQIHTTSLSTEQIQVLKKAVAEAEAYRQRGGPYPDTIRDGQGIAREFGKKGDISVLQFIAELKAIDLINAFSNGFVSDYRGGSNAAIEEYVIRHRRDPVIGHTALRLVRPNSSEPLFSALLSDLSLPSPFFGPATDGRIDKGVRYKYATAALMSDVTNMESRLLEYLNDPSLRFLIADFLAKKKYKPSEPYIFDLLNKIPVASSEVEVGHLFNSAVELGTQRMHDLLVKRLIELGRLRESGFRQTTFDYFLKALVAGAPDITLNPAIREVDNLAQFSAEQRGAIEKAIKFRDEETKRATEITSNNLSYWIRDSNTAMVRQFIVKGVNLNSQDGSGETPLTVAAAVYKSDPMKLLLQAGANPNRGNSKGDKPLGIAVQYKPIQPDPQQYEKVNALLVAGADISAAGYDGRTPLHNAVSSANLEMVKMLIENKASINAECVDQLLRAKGVTPLQLAIDLKHKDIENYLRDRGGTVSWTMLARRKANSFGAAIIGPFLISH